MGNIESYLQYAILLTMPAITCVVMYLFLKRHEARLEGTILTSMKFTVVGPIAFYVLLVSLSIRWIAPKLIPDPNEVDLAGNWKIEIRQEGKGFVEPRGRIGIVQKGADVALKGIVEYKDSSREDVHARYGEIEREQGQVRFLLDLKTGAVKNLAVFEGHLQRSIFGYTIEGEYNLLQGEKHWAPIGRIMFTRPNWVFVYVLVILVPLIIFLALSWTLPLSQAAVRGTFLGTTMGLGGPVAGYFLVLIVSFGGYDRLFLRPEFTGIKLEEETSFGIGGKWNMRYVNEHGELEGTGTVTIDQKGTKINVNGAAVPVRKKMAHPVHWTSRFGRLSKDGDIFFYYEVAGGTGDRGVLFGVLQDQKPDDFTLTWLDFVKSPGSNKGTCYYTKNKGPVGRKEKG